MGNPSAPGAQTKSAPEPQASRAAPGTRPSVRPSLDCCRPALAGKGTPASPALPATDQRSLARADEKLEGHAPRFAGAATAHAPKPWESWCSNSRGAATLKSARTRNPPPSKGTRADREPRPGLGRPPKTAGTAGCVTTVPRQYSVTFISGRQGSYVKCMLDEFYSVMEQPLLLHVILHRTVCPPGRHCRRH
jgi:hypothetical protein